MDNIPMMIAAVVLAGLAFDFVNGFNDAANSIATIVATRVLKPRQAVLWASFFNFVAIFFFGTAVAKTVGSGLIDLHMVVPEVILCGLLGAITWGLFTWRLRLPTSSSHSLLGGYAGAAMAHNMLANGIHAIGDPIIVAGWIKVIAFIVLAPLMGLLVSHLFMGALLMAEKRFQLSAHDRTHKALLLTSSAALSLMHGSNDAQKTAGILAGALAAGGIFATFTIPFWLLGLSYGMMGLGTFCGGWRIVETMGKRLTRLEPRGGVCAQSAAAISIFVATCAGLPVSTTHVTTGSILGVGVASKNRVGWKIARRIAWAWIFTIPAAALSGGCVMMVASIFGK